MKKFTQIVVVVVNLEIVPFQVTLASYRVTVGGFVPVKAFSKSQKLLFVSASSFVFKYYLHKVCPKSFWRPKTFLKLRVSRSDDTMAAVNTFFSSLDIFKSSRTLFVSVYPFFLLVKSSC